MENIEARAPLHLHEAQSALSAAQVLAWADPAKRAARIAGLKAAWAGELRGGRARSREWQDAILADYIAGEFIDVIAARHDCSRAYPAQIAQRRGLDLPKRRPGRRPQ